MTHDWSHEVVGEKEKNSQIAAHYPGQESVGPAGKVDQSEETAAGEQSSDRRQVSGQRWEQDSSEQHLFTESRYRRKERYLDRRQPREERAHLTLHQRYKPA